MRRSQRFRGIALVAAAVACPTVARAAGGLNLDPNWALVAVNVAIFLLLVIPTNRLLLIPLVRILEERERRTQGARAEAEAGVAQASRARADLEGQLRAARERAQVRRAALAATAQDDERRVLESARKDARAELDRVRDGVAAELEAARATLRSDAHALAREAAAKLLGRPL